MAVFKCKMCGGALEVTEVQVLATCEYCGTQQTLPKIDDEKKLALFNRANNLRLKCEFDKAAGIYESLIAEFLEEAEAYWGLVLCKYGIEYVDDKDGSKIPTCHRTLPTSIMKDEDFQQACENADASAKNVYREEAKAIDGIQKKILEIAATEEPYDIFICYKETDENTGARTEDSSIAQDIYTALTEMGYKVFYARNSLRKVAGTEYEPYIYAALSSAKIMLAIGTKFEYYDAVWVKNEWSRFISMIANNPAKILIPCFKNMDAYDIPEEFGNMQALDMADMMFFNSLEASVKRALPLETKGSGKEAPAVNNNTTVTVDTLLKRAFMFLGDGNFEIANEYCEKVLDITPECAQAYLGKMMVERKIRKVEDLSKCETTFAKNANFQKAMNFGNTKLKTELQGYLDIVTRNEEEKAELKRQAEEARLAKEKKKKKRRRKIAIAVPISIVSILLCVALLITVIIPKIKFSDITAISAGSNHTVGLKVDGTVVAVGDNDYGQCDVEDWTDIMAISAGMDHTVGLKKDGTVVAVGRNDEYIDTGRCDVSDWTDITAISAGCACTVGLKTDGTVVATGVNTSGECDVSDWKDIIAISAGTYHTLGLMSDGTVVAVGDNDYGQCDVSKWKDIVAIDANSYHTVGLKKDGTVVAVGDNDYGQCDVEDWTDIVAIDAYSYHTVGLKKDGTVVAVGDNDYGQCNVSEWMSITAIAAGRDHTVALKSDGTVVAVGSNVLKQSAVGRTK